MIKIKRIASTIFQAHPQEQHKYRPGILTSWRRQRLNLSCRGEVRLWRQSACNGQDAQSSAAWRQSQGSPPGQCHWFQWKKIIKFKKKESQPKGAWGAMTTVWSAVSWTGFWNLKSALSEKETNMNQGRALVNNSSIWVHSLGQMYHTEVKMFFKPVF